MIQIWISNCHRCIFSSLICWLLHKFTHFEVSFRPESYFSVVPRSSRVFSGMNQIWISYSSLPTLPWGLPHASLEKSTSGASNPRPKVSFSEKRGLNFEETKNLKNPVLQNAGCIKNPRELLGLELQKESSRDFFQEPNYLNGLQMV